MNPRTPLELAGLAIASHSLEVRRERSKLDTALIDHQWLAAETAIRDLRFALGELEQAVARYRETEKGRKAGTHEFDDGADYPGGAERAADAMVREEASQAAERPGTTGGTY